jgi:hypothetical protein
MPDLNQAILDELKAIRALLASGAKPATAAPAAASTASPTPDGPPPQPDTVVENAASTTIHFGKNTGKALGELGEKSLGWYASVKAPRLDNSGKPFPPRPADVALEQAARTLWHQQKGTLTTGTAPLPGGGAPSAEGDEIQF